MRVVLIAGPGPTTEAVRGAFRDDEVVDVVDLDAGLHSCRADRPHLVVAVFPETGFGAGPLLRFLHELDAECPLLAVVPPGLIGERRLITDAGMRYLPPPVDRHELLAAARQLVRAADVGVTWIGDVSVDRPLRRAMRAGIELRLTRKEYDLLAHLARNRAVVVTKEQLLDAVWGSQAYSPNVVEVTVSALRRKLERHGPRVIHTVRGVGYVCRADPAAAPRAASVLERHRILLAHTEELVRERDALVARSQALRRQREDLG